MNAKKQLLVNALAMFCALPVLALEVVVEAGDANTLSTGGWYYAGAATAGYKGNKGVYASVSGSPKTYTFSSALPLSSLYRVDVFNSCYSPKSHNVKHHIHSSNGTSTVVADQDCNTDPYVGNWRSLGEYSFNQNTLATVVIDSDGSNNSYLGATAVRFTSIDRVKKSLVLGNNTWFPFNQYYDGSASCIGPSTVSGLPAGIAIDTLCNLYGAPTSEGDYLSAIPLTDGSTWQIDFSIQTADSNEAVAQANQVEATPVAAPANVEKILPIGQSVWLPFSGFYTGNATCNGTVENLPLGLAFDTVCNIYGTPTEEGVYAVSIPLNDNSSWNIHFSITSLLALNPSQPTTTESTNDPDATAADDSQDESLDNTAAPAQNDELVDASPVINEPDTTATDLSNPLLFSLVVPPLAANNFGHQLETFANHQTGMIQQAPRGGDLCLMDVNRNIRYLTREAGFGVYSGEVQADNAIAVRQPTVHWSATKALFSMVVGGPTQAYDQHYRSNRWQIYEITNLDQVINGAVATIVLVANQPNYNNVSPVYGSDDSIIFTSDAPLFGMSHTYPQMDEYESTVTNTGIFKLNQTTGQLIHLSHAPSGDFDLSVASDGRIISTRWEHLKRDQQASNHRAGNTPWAPVNYVSEAAGAQIVSAPAFVDGKAYADADGTPYEIFPEAFVHFNNGVEVEPNRDLNEPLHDFNEFLPWEISQNGENHQTLNHAGRHEFGGVFQNGSKIDDPNLSFELGNLTSNQQRDTVQSDAGIFQIKEDPRPGYEGTFYGTWAEEFGRFSSGRIFEFSLPVGKNPQDMAIIDWTNPLIDNSDNTLGHFRNPLRMMDGSMVASYATQSAIFSSSNPSPYVFRLVKLIKRTATSASTEHVASQPLLGEPIQRDIAYWGDSTSLQLVSVVMSETDAVEIVSKPVPAVSETIAVKSIEKQVMDEEGVDEQLLRNWLVENNLALIVIRNATERDAGERQQPFNLRVPDGVETVATSGKIYDISHLQLFSAELIRGYGLRNYSGRRSIATPLRNTEKNPNIVQRNLIDPNSPVEAGIKISSDGSAAAFVPATRAMTWQTVAPDGEAIVRERQWVTFAPGEIRTCEGCHGINDVAMSGNAVPQNKPEALRDLLQLWKQSLSAN